MDNGAVPVPVEPVARPPASARPWHQPGGLAGLATRGNGQATQARTYAWVNWGFWVAWCPFCPYPHSQRLAIGQDRFVCVLCNNGAAGGRWVEVAWPDPQTRRQAEEILALRPMTMDVFGEEHCPRNWNPHEETLEFLRRENLENGWPVPRRGLIARIRG